MVIKPNERYPCAFVRQTLLLTSVSLIHPLMKNGLGAIVTSQGCCAGEAAAQADLKALTGSLGHTPAGMR